MSHDNYLLGTAFRRSRIEDFNIKDLAIQIPFRVGGIEDTKQLSYRIDHNQESLKSQINRLLFSLDAVFDNIRSELKGFTRPFIRVGHTGSPGQSIPHNVWTPITFNQVDEKSMDGIWDSSEPTKLVAPLTGFYVIYGNANIQAAAGKTRRLAVQKNGSVWLARMGANIDTFDSGGSSGYSVTTIDNLQAGDYVELLIMQGDASGSSRSLNYSNGQPKFGLYLITKEAIT